MYEAARSDPGRAALAANEGSPKIAVKQQHAGVKFHGRRTLSHKRLHRDTIVSKAADFAALGFPAGCRSNQQTATLESACARNFAEQSHPSMNKAKAQIH